MACNMRLGQPPCALAHRRAAGPIWVAEAASLTSATSRHVRDALPCLRCTELLLLVSQAHCQAPRHLHEEGIPCCTSWRLGINPRWLDGPTLMHDGALVNSHQRFRLTAARVGCRQRFGRPR